MSKVLDWNKVKTVEDLKAVIHIGHYPDTMAKSFSDPTVRVHSGMTKEDALADIEHLLVDVGSKVGDGND